MSLRATQESEKTTALLAQLFAKNVVKNGDFILKSGLRSSLYIDLRLLLNEPAIIKEISHLIYKKINVASILNPKTKLCGVPYGALPFSCCVSTEYGLPQIIVRKESKKHGTKKLIEGVFADGDELLIIEDIVTTGSSIIELITKLKTYNLKVQQIIVIIDRTNDKMKKLKDLGYSVASIFETVPASDPASDPAPIPFTSQATPF